MHDNEQAALEIYDEELRELRERAKSLIDGGLLATERRLLQARLDDAEQAMVAAHDSGGASSAETTREAEKMLRVLFHALWHVEQRGHAAPGDTTAVGSTRPVSLLARSLERRRS